jgi:hypothetical protein
MGGLALMNLLATATIGQLTDMPMNVAATLVSLCGAATFLVLAVELQRQRIRSGQWRFRFGLGALLLAMAIAAVFFAVMASACRQNQQSFAESQTLKSELEAVLRGGTVSISMPGRGITCQVTRPTFSDDDLARVIDLASAGGTRTCELTMLFLAGTGVTNAGLCRLAACEKLTLVEPPPLNLSDEAVDALSKCGRLEFLPIDESRLSAAQIARLRESLPRLRLNGRTWAQRDGTK